METHLTLIARAAPGRLVGMNADHTLRLVWDDATYRVALYDLPHLAALLDAWRYEEEPPFLRRGYYRIERASDGRALLWLNNSALALSREELVMLCELIEAVEAQLSAPTPSLPLQPFGPGFRRFAGPGSATQWKN